MGDDGLDPYRKMAQMRVPKGAIVAKMKQNGISNEVVEKYEESGVLPEGGMYTKMKEMRGYTIGSWRYDRILLKSKEWEVRSFELIGKPNMPSDHLGIVATLKRE